MVRVLFTPAMPIRFQVRPKSARYLTRDGGPEDGFWIHLDADVFDETIMKAVDDPGRMASPGMRWSRR
jgi:hypothetical protein